MASFSGTFTAGGQISDAILNRVGESIRFTLTGSWTGITVLEKSTSREGWKIIRVFRGNFDSSTKNLDHQNCYLRLRCLSLVTGSVGWALEDIEDEFIFEQFLRDGTQAIGVTDAGDLYVLGSLFSGGGGGSVTIQTPTESPVGSLFTFDSSDSSITIDGNAVTDEIDFIVDPTQGALATALAGKQATGNYLTALTGDVAASGPGSAAATLATVNSNVGAFTSANITVDAKGRVTAAASGSGGGVTRNGSTLDNAQARWDGNSADVLQGGKWIEDDNGRITVDIGDTATGATYGTRWTATLTGTAGGVHAIERMDVTTAGSGAGAFVLGRWVRLLAGYTGGGMCAGDWVINNCASTGTDLNGGGGNMGYRSVMGGSGGHSACYYGDISSTSTRMYGVLIDIEAGGSSGVGVGYSTSVHPGSGTYKAACFYGKLSGSPGQVPGVTAGAVFDNGATAFPGLVVQDAGTTMFSVEDKSNIVCGAQSAVSTTATDGFVYIPTCAGAPSGVPTAYTGKVALVFDSTNNNLYLYNGAWKKTTTFA